MEGWFGRVDSEDGDLGLRWHQVIREWDVLSDPGFCFLGFESDEGVRRNQGRVGAIEGPNALRSALSSLPANTDLRLYDAGNIVLVDGDLEQGQTDFAAQIADLIRHRQIPIALGGGHEIAFGSFAGIAQSGLIRAGTKIGILNFDAHFDLRRPDPSHSGNSFSQAFRMAQASNLDLMYWVMGLSEASNTDALYWAASDVEADWVGDTEMTLHHAESCHDRLRAWLNQVDILYMTICLDVLPAYQCPGVSSPAARGVSIEVIEPLVEQAAKSGKLVAADIAELNPSFDIDNRTARTASRLIWRIVQGCREAKGASKK